MINQKLNFRSVFRHFIKIDFKKCGLSIHLFEGKITGLPTCDVHQIQVAVKGDEQ